MAICMAVHLILASDFWLLQHRNMSGVKHRQPSVGGPTSHRLPSLAGCSTIAALPPCCLLAERANRPHGRPTGRRPRGEDRSRPVWARRSAPMVPLAEFWHSGAVTPSTRPDSSHQRLIHTSAVYGPTLLFDPATLQVDGGADPRGGEMLAVQPARRDLFCTVRLGRWRGRRVAAPMPQRECVPRHWAESDSPARARALA